MNSEPETDVDLFLELLLTGELLHVVQRPLKLIEFLVEQVL
jgi:hypothetical protein